MADSLMPLHWRQTLTRPDQLSGDVVELVLGEAMSATDAKLHQLYVVEEVAAPAPGCGLAVTRPILSASTSRRAWA